MDRPVLYHFSEDASIRRFEPHTPKTNPTHPPAVWAIDAPHAPLYWFPRDCPRATAWPRQIDERVEFTRTLATTARRLHAIEADWLDAVNTTTVYRYEFDAASFEPWSEASGQWVSAQTVEPLNVAPLGNLLDLHAESGIELRLVPDLWPIVDLMSDDRWEFSHVRLANARRPGALRPNDQRPTAR